MDIGFQADHLLIRLKELQERKTAPFYAMKAQYFELQKKIRKAEQDMERARMKRHDMIGMKGQEGKQEPII